MKQFYTLLFFMASLCATLQAQFEFKVRTTTANESFTIPTKAGETYDYSVSYFKSAGQLFTNIRSGTGNITITFDDPGIHDVSIQGALSTTPIGGTPTNESFPAIYFNNSGDKDKMVSIEKWGTNSWLTMENAFYGCSNLVVNATDIPDLSLATSLENMFRDCPSVDFNLGNWDITTITQMNGMFRGGKLSANNYDTTLNGWYSQDPQFNVTFDAGVSTYCTAATAHSELADPIASIYDWNIVDGGQACEEEKFITTWTVTGSDLTIPIYMLGASNNYTVDWGDFTLSKGITGDTTHTYTSAGTYTVKIYGDFSQMYFLDRTGKEKIRTIEQWSTHQWTNMENAFQGCTNLVLNANDTPDLSLVTNMTSMFEGTTQLEDLKNNIGNWNVNNVENLTATFKNSGFNQNINTWNVSNVRFMDSLFEGASDFNQPLNNWNTNSLAFSNAVFKRAIKFNQELSDWNMSSVQEAGQMFLEAEAFDQSLGAWDISSMTSMEQMIRSARISTANYDTTLFGWATLDVGETQIPSDISFHGGVSSYCISAAVRQSLINNYKWAITDGSLICEEEDKFISTWETTGTNEEIQIRTTDGGSRFSIEWGDGTTTAEGGSDRHRYTTPGTYTVKISGALGNLYANNQNVSRKMLSIEQWGAAKFTSFRNAFLGVNKLVINATDTPDLSNVTTMIEAFKNCSVLVDNGGQMKHWDVSNVQDFTETFRGSPLFDENLGNWDLSSATTLLRMLNGAGLSATNYDATLEGWATNPSTPNGLTFNASGVQYCTAEAARTTLDITKTWNLSDGGLGCNDDSTAFITTWRIASDDETITIPTTGSGYDYIVDWGDGSSNTTETGNATHQYTAGAADYQIKIWGDFPRIYFNDTGDKDKIISIDQWGTQQWTSMHKAFQGCTNLVLNADDTPDFSAPTLFNMHQMFQGAINFVDSKDKIGDWNVSNVQNMYATFAQCSEFNEDISSWQVGNVRTFLQMFLGNTKFNQNISGWNTESATVMGTMFAGATTFNQDISGWNTSNVTQMHFMFSSASNFNQDISGWDVSKVQRMDNMFNGATEFNQDLSTWDISSLGTHPTRTETAENMFTGATKFSSENYDKLLSGWSTLNTGETLIPTDVILGANSTTYCLGETARNTLTTSPFNWTITDAGLGCAATDFFVTTWETTSANESITIPTSGNGYNFDIDWGDGSFEYNITTGNPSHTYESTGTYTVKISRDFPRIYFNNTGDLTKIKTIEQWGTISWLNMNEAFSGCTALVLNANDTPDLSSVEDLSSMFKGATNLVDNKDQIETWDVGNISNFSSMFQSASKFNENINSWNIGEQVTGEISMGIMFDSATAFNQPINNWDMSKVTATQSMFSFATSFNQPLDNWNTSNIENMGGMFFGATDFDQNVGNWNLSSVTNMSSMFQQAGLSTGNYDATLIGWAKQDNGETIPSNINISFEGSTYCFGTEARNTLTDNTGLNWNISDDGAACDLADAFITTWNIATDNEAISIPVVGSNLDFSIDWGDGTITSGETQEAYHTYASAGTYTIKMIGDFRHIAFNDNVDRDKIRTIEQWGSQQWTSMENAFKGCGFLVINATDTPDLSNATSLVSMFENGTCIDNGGNIGNWNVSNIVSMNGMFANATMNENINAWNVGSVKTIDYMFSGCEDFNYPLDQWNTDNLESASETFLNTKSFNQSLGSWNISNVSDFTDIFKGTSRFSDENYDATLIGWATLESGESLRNNVSLGAGDLKYCISTSARDILTSPPNNWIITDGGASCAPTDFFITTWQTTAANQSIEIPTLSSQTYDYDVDWGDGTFSFNQTDDVTHEYATVGIYTVKISGVYPHLIFGNSSNGNKEKILTIEQWGTQQWGSMESTFTGCTHLKLNADDIPNLSNVEKTQSMFRRCSNFEDLKDNIGSWNVSNIKEMDAMFHECTIFNENISNWNTSSMIGANLMFSETNAFNQPIGNWNTQNMERSVGMFEDAIAFNQPIGDWDVSNITSCFSMFNGASSFNQNLGNWDISSIPVYVGGSQLEDFFTGSALSQENYDNTLIGWSIIDNVNGETTIPINQILDADATYCLGEAARNKLINDFGWTINDGGLSCITTDFFITTWQTTLDNEVITIPTTGNGYSYSIAWGDGAFDFGKTGNASHTYAIAGTYTVKIIGDFPRIHFDNSASTDYVKSIEQWGTISWTSMEDAFRGCSDLVINATDSPDLSNVTNMSFMFSGCTNIGSPDISGWDTSNITNMRSLFAFSRFNGNISSWNVGKVTSFNSTFRDATQFNQDISGWNIGEFVTGTIDMTEMFRVANQFQQSINAWDVSKVNNMDGMFRSASRYNQPLDNWDVSNVQFMEDVFFGARRFDQNLASWDISSATKLNDFFTGSALSLENYDNTLIGWSTLETGETQIPTNLTLNADATYCLATTARNILTADPYSWNITDGGQSCDFTNAFITTWETMSDNENITIPTTGIGYDYFVDWGDGVVEVDVTGNATHEYATAGTYTVKIIGDFPRIYFNNSGDKDNILTIEQWGINEWFSFEKAFYGCSNLVLNANDIFAYNDVGSLSMKQMFEGATNLEDLKDKIGDWDVSNVGDMSRAFAYCSKFNEDIKDWEVTSVENFNHLFFQATAFNQSIGGWITSNVRRMASVFSGATSFNQPLNTWDTSRVQEMEAMFKDATTFNQDISNWDVADVKSMNEMFSGATAFNQNLASWDISSLGILRFPGDTNKGLENMLVNSGISAANYDATLIGWATLSTEETQIPTNISLDADATYCLGEIARNTLTSLTYNWTINDGGQNCVAKTAINVYLLGAALNPKTGEENLMRDDLRSTAVMPSTSPYADAIRTTESVLTNTSSAADTVVDWIWVELRDQNNGTTVIEGRSALLQRDGDVVDIDGTSPVEFTVDPDAYYVVINHRNHLAIRSKDVVTFNGSTVTIDFSSTPSTIEGGLNAVTQLPNGKYAIYAGDVDGNGQTQNSDINILSGSLGSSGYQAGDADMNGQIQNTDINSIVVPCIGKAEQF